MGKEIDYRCDKEHKILLGDMHAKTRYNISLAKRKGVKIKFSKEQFSVDVESIQTIKLEHQGGDGITMTSTATKITVDGNSVTYDTTGYDAQFDAGETQYVYRTSAGYFITNDSTATILGLSPIDVVAAGATSNVKIIDVASQQMIADLDVRF